MTACLISAEALRNALPGSDWLVFDVRHNLADHQAGRRAYTQGHIPGAIFLDHEQDLCATKTGRNGRHPLPTLADFAALMRLQGLTPERQAIVYDEGSSMFAAHLWWMLRWLGHAHVRVLDGGWQAWVAAGGAIQTRVDIPATTEAQVIQHAGWGARAAMPTVNTQQVEQNIHTPAFVVVDARAPERFRGETEPMDPVAGHIPGALNRPSSVNLTPEGRFKPAAQLRTEFQALLGNKPAAQVVHQCGSGITACHNLLAMEIAGLPGSLLYPGSWSEWCSDLSRPVATGIT